MREIPYDEVGENSAYMLTMVCRKCGQEISRTRVFHDPESVINLYEEAQNDRMVNWCGPCGSMGDIHVWEMNEGENETFYLLNVHTQQPEIDHWCFRKCGKISVTCVTLDSEEGKLSFLLCRSSSCPNCEREVDLGPGKTKEGITGQYIVRILSPV
ncbi:MAG: hypothetical protein HXS52_13510 [Theionarchaea archaeon]|nr:hypothetical protein [Theionarchaea archaeon]MBU7038942.1 hypothetical protein [Theionarchaea archaeon]